MQAALNKVCVYINTSILSSFYFNINFIFCVLKSLLELAKAIDFPVHNSV